MKYWGVGNEPWLQAGKPDFADIAKKIEAYYKEIVPGMKAVDPTIKIYGPNMCYYEKRVYEALFGGTNDIAGKISGKDVYDSPRSTAAHMQMVILNMKGEYCAGKSNNDEVVVFGSKDASRVCAMILNRSEEARTYTLRLNKGSPSAKELTLNLDAGIGVDYSDTIRGMESQMIIFTVAGAPSEKWTYNDSMNGQWANHEKL